LQNRARTTDPDLPILQRVIDGDRAAFAELVDRHKAPGMTLAVRILQNTSDAEEALQDAFLRAFRALPEFKFEARFATWFYRILYNVCCSKQERLRNNMETISISDDDEIGTVISGAHTNEAIDQAEVYRITIKEIERLPAEYNSVLTLFTLQEFKLQEIVEITGMPIGTVKARIFRGRAMLRDRVEKILSHGLTPTILISDKVGGRKLL
jgi:RNA polymerase sigma-70 factor (ECF subfamily)